MSPCRASVSAPFPSLNTWLLPQLREEVTAGQTTPTQWKRLTSCLTSFKHKRWGYVQLQAQIWLSTWRAFSSPGSRLENHKLRFRCKPRKYLQCACGATENTGDFWKVRNILLSSSQVPLNVWSTVPKFLPVLFSSLHSEYISVWQRETLIKAQL